MSWLNSVEFYVIAGAIAAAVVALSALPSRRGAAVLHTVAGDLSDSSSAEPSEPSIDVEVDDNRRVIIRRTGLVGVGDTGAASLAVNVVGFDIDIEERLTAGRLALERRDTAVFTLDFLGAERYHLRYNSEDAGVFAAFSLPVREGIRIHRVLK